MFPGVVCDLDHVSKIELQMFFLSSNITNDQLSYKKMVRLGNTLMLYCYGDVT